MCCYQELPGPPQLQEAEGLGGRGHPAGITADPTGHRGLVWVKQLAVSGPRALAKKVVSGGRTG